jgi:hypothetical protein
VFITDMITPNCEPALLGTTLLRGCVGTGPNTQHIRDLTVNEVLRKNLENS